MEFSKISERDIIDKFTKVPASGNICIKLSSKSFSINDEVYDLITQEDWSRAYYYIEAFRDINSKLQKQT